MQSAIRQNIPLYLWTDLMTSPAYFQKILCFCIATFIVCCANAQVDIRGTIYDRSLRIALQGVTVTASSGRNAVTDAKGNYRITLPATDSIWFSYLTKRTKPFPVNAIDYPQQFDMSLDVLTDSLPPVTVWSKNYYQDSVENRKEYEKVFNYGGPEVLSTGMNNGQASAGLNLDMLFNMAKGRRMEAFQKRLLADEQDRYISHRFTKTLVNKITGLLSPQLDSFMRQYRPTYSDIQAFETEYEYYKYIKQCSVWFREDQAAMRPGIDPVPPSDAAAPEQPESAGKF